MMERKSFARHELVGLGAVVVEAKNRSLIGIGGIVVDETKNTITVEDKNHVAKKLVKDQVTLQFSGRDGTVTLKGEVLSGRPEDRLKKKM